MRQAGLSRRYLRQVCAGVLVVMGVLVWVLAVPGAAYGCGCTDATLSDYADEIDVAFVGLRVVLCA